MKQEIVKTLLYAYPHMNGFAEAAQTAAYNKAVLSFSSYATALDAAAAVAEEVFCSRRLSSLAEELSRMIGALREEERFLLEYKYFRRRARLREYGDRIENYSQRSYFRKQNALLAKLGARLAEAGWTDERFFEEFGTCSLLSVLFKAVAAGRESAIFSKRAQAGIKFQKSERSESGGGSERFFPRSTKAATATAAAHATQIATICTALSPPVFADPGSPSAGPDGTLRKSSFRSKAGSSRSGI